MQKDQFVQFVATGATGVTTSDEFVGVWTNGVSCIHVQFDDGLRCFVAVDELQTLETAVAWLRAVRDEWNEELDEDEMDILDEDYALGLHDEA